MMMRMIYCIYRYMYYPAHVSKNNTKRSVQSMANKEGGRRTFLAVALLLALAWCGRSDQTVKHLLREMGLRKTTFTLVLSRALAVSQNDNRIRYAA